jgi:hypothetical protein
MGRMGTIHRNDVCNDSEGVKEGADRPRQTTAYNAMN